MLVIWIILAICIIRKSCLHFEEDAIASPPARSKRDATQPPEVAYLWKKLHTAGHWASWGPWICDALCGRGAYFRKRHCVPSDDFGLPVCKGMTVERSAEECKVKCPGLSEIRRKWIGPKLTDAETRAHTKLLSSSHGAFQRRVGEVIQFDCYNLLTVHFLSNYSRSILYWERNGKKLRFDFNRMTITDYSILAIANLETTDSGVYACKMEFTKSLHLTILVFSLIVIGQPYDLQVTANSAFKVKCNSDVIGKLFPKSHVLWIVNKTEHVLKDYGDASPEKINEDIISSFSETDTGLWVCVIRERISNRTWLTNAFYVKVIPNAFVAACRRIFEHIPLKWFLFIIGILTVLTVIAMYFTIRTKRIRKQKLLKRLNDILQISTEIDEDFATGKKMEKERPSSMASSKVIVKTKIQRQPKTKIIARSLKQKIRSAFRKITAGKLKIKPLKDAIGQHDMASGFIADGSKDEREMRRKTRYTPTERHKRLRISLKPLNLVSSASSMEELGSGSETTDSENYVALGRRVVTRHNIEEKDEEIAQTPEISENESESVLRKKITSLKEE